MELVDRDCVAGTSTPEGTAVIVYLHIAAGGNHERQVLPASMQPPSAGQGLGTVPNQLPATVLVTEVQNVAGISKVHNPIVATIAGIYPQHKCKVTRNTGSVAGQVTAFAHVDGGAGAGVGAGHTPTMVADSAVVSVCRIIIGGAAAGFVQAVVRHYIRRGTTKQPQ